MVPSLATLSKVVLENMVPCVCELHQTSSVMQEVSGDAVVHTEVRDARVQADIDKLPIDDLHHSDSCFHDVFVAPVVDKVVIEQHDVKLIYQCKVNDSGRFDNISGSLHDDWTVCCAPKPYQSRFCCMYFMWGELDYHLEFK